MPRVGSQAASMPRAMRSFSSSCASVRRTRCSSNFRMNRPPVRFARAHIQKNWQHKNSFALCSMQAAQSFFCAASFSVCKPAGKSVFAKSGADYHAMGMPWARRARTMQWKAFCACRLPATCGSTATRAVPSSSFTTSPPSTRDVTHEGARDRTRSHGARREARLADDHAHEMNINSLILSWVGRRMNK